MHNLEEGYLALYLSLSMTFRGVFSLCLQKSSSYRLPLSISKKLSGSSPTLRVLCCVGSSVTIEYDNVKQKQMSLSFLPTLNNLYMTTAISILPRETIGVILLCLIDNYASLKQCSLVSHIWNGEARRLLFREVILGDRPLNFEREIEPSRMKDILTQSPLISSHVTALTIKYHRQLTRRNVARSFEAVQRVIAPIVDVLVKLSEGRTNPSQLHQVTIDGFYSGSHPEFVFLRPLTNAIATLISSLRTPSLVYFSRCNIPMVLQLLQSRKTHIHSILGLSNISTDIGKQSRNQVTLIIEF